MERVTGAQIVSLSRVFVESSDQVSTLQEMQRLIDSGLLADLRDVDVSRIDRLKFRRGLGLCPLQAKDFKVWRTLSIGADIKDETAFLQACMNQSILIDDWTKTILDRVDFTQEPMTLELVNVSPREMGFRRGTTRTNIVRRAESFGLRSCPEDTALHLRRAYHDQPIDEELYVVDSELIVGQDMVPQILCVICFKDCRALTSANGSLDNTWVPDTRFIFARNRPQPIPTIPVRT